MEFNNVAILLTENCNARCEMCCDSRGRVVGKTLDINEIDLILENINNVKSINHISLTGGEPMLYKEMVEYILNYKFNRNISISLKTNGFWGNNFSKAEEFISKYAKKISKISLSYDEFHIPFINVDSLKNIIKISTKNNIPTEVVACFLNDSMKPGEILDMLGEESYYTDYYFQPVIKTGSAKDFNCNKYIKLLDTDRDILACIATSDPDLTINPNLDVFPCCSQVIENTILKIGNLKEDTLENIIQSVLHNEIFCTLFSEGFTPFLNLLIKNNIEYPKELASPCEFCEFLFKSDWFLEILKNEKFYSSLKK